MANNELSGPIVSMSLINFFKRKKNKKTIRFIFIPETIGSISYIKHNLKSLKKNVIGGYILTCIGDNRTHSCMLSKYKNTVSDYALIKSYNKLKIKFKEYSFLENGSDERQFCSPMVELPLSSIFRSKYGTYPEYHTSLDDLKNVVTPAGLAGGFVAACRCVEALERDCYPRVTVLGEPQMGKYGLYPTLSQSKVNSDLRLMMSAISYADGQHSMLDIATRCKVPVWMLYEVFDRLEENGLIVKNKTSKTLVLNQDIE